MTISVIYNGIGEFGIKIVNIIIVTFITYFYLLPLLIFFLGIHIPVGKVQPVYTTCVFNGIVQQIDVMIRLLENVMRVYAILPLTIEISM